MPKYTLRNCGFTILWLCYSAVYLTRKPLGIIKTDLEKNYKYSRFVIGILDSALLLPYALFQIIFGNLGDSLNPTLFLAACIIGSGISTLFLGPLDQIWVLIIFLFLNGSFQSFCWPLSIKIVSTLFDGSTNQHFVLGVFGTSTFAGGTLGTFLSVFIKDYLSWKWVYPIPSVIILISGMGLILFYKCSFKKLLETFKMAEIGRSNRELKVEEKKKVSFWYHIKASLRLFWTVPLVAHVSVAMFSLKMIRYIFYMWLPFMLEYKNNFSSTKAGNISAIFEVGGVIGSILLGYIMDKCFSKSQFLGIIYMLFLQIISVISFLLSTNPSLHWLINATFLLFAGIMNGGIDNLLSSSIPLIISSCFKTQAPSAIVGIVNGFGSLGTFLEGPLVGFVLDYSSSNKNVSVPINATMIHQGKHVNGDINFVGLFAIIGSFSVLPTIVMSLGYYRYGKIVKSYCSNGSAPKKGRLANGSLPGPGKDQISEDKLGVKPMEEFQLKDVTKTNAASIVDKNNNKLITKVEIPFEENFMGSIKEIEPDLNIISTQNLDPKNNTLT